MQSNINLNRKVSRSYPAALRDKEQELVASLRKGGNKAYAYLYDNYGNQLFTVVLGVIPDYGLASDVLQDVFANIYKSIGTYDESRGQLYTWMINIARHAAIDMLRSKGYRNYKDNVQMSSDVLESIITYPLVDSIGLKKVLFKIKPKYRELIELNYLKGYTNSEIAQLLGMPLGTVKTRIKSALRQLRELV